MSTEPLPEVNLDTLGAEAIDSEVRSLERTAAPLVTLNCTLASLDRARSMQCALRAVNISTLVVVKRDDSFAAGDDALPLFSLLQDWDQMLLQNFLEFCEARVPGPVLPSLRIEAKLELKWFREWLTAASDPRIYKYPGLPWRSFVRKVNVENFAFAEKFLELTATPSPENEKALGELLKAFLVAKKKVLCVFPKNWGRN